MKSLIFPRHRPNQVVHQPCRPDERLEDQRTFPELDHYCYSPDDDVNSAPTRSLVDADSEDDEEEVEEEEDSTPAPPPRGKRTRYAHVQLVEKAIILTLCCAKA